MFPPAVSLGVAEMMACVGQARTHASQSTQFSKMIALLLMTSIALNAHAPKQSREPTHFSRSTVTGMSDQLAVAQRADQRDGARRGIRAIDDLIGSFLAI